MNKDSKIFVAGHRGLVGSAITRKLLEKGYNNLVFRTHSELDLLVQKDVFDFFDEEKPKYVFLAAAKVGGIMANSIYRAQFIYENLQIQNNIIQASHKSGVKKLMFLGSSCIYPKDAPQPIKEDYLLSSPLEYTNEPYAIAKIAGIKMCESYNFQYETDYISVMPTNLYGPGDNYDLVRSHVMPALIRKMYLAKCLLNNDWESIEKDINRLPIDGVNGNSSKESIVETLEKFGVFKRDTVEVKLWGTGNPLREFLHSDDMADACVYLMEHVSFKDLSENMSEIRNTHINIGTGEDLKISALAEMVKSIVGFEGKISWDASKPDGTYRKLLDVSKLQSLGWKYHINLGDGIKRVYSDYLKY